MSVITVTPRASSLARLPKIPPGCVFDAPPAVTKIAWYFAALKNHVYVIRLVRGSSASRKQGLLDSVWKLFLRVN
jgi:hypothetical protein